MLQDLGLALIDHRNSKAIREGNFAISEAENAATSMLFRAKKNHLLTKSNVSEFVSKLNLESVLKNATKETG